MPKAPERSLTPQSSIARSVSASDGAFDGAGGSSARAPAPAVDSRDPVDALLVGVRDDTDVETSLAEAAGRARCEGRALVVAVVRPPAPLSTDAVIQQRAADRVTRDLIRRRCLVRTTCAHAGVKVRDLRTVAQPWRLSRHGQDRALRRRLHALARTLHAELHPLPHRHHADDIVLAGHARPISPRATSAAAGDADGRVR